MMSEITLSAAMRSALMSVVDTVQKREKTQRNLQSGKAVNDAVDDAVRYFKSKGLSDRAENFTAVKQGMDQAISLVKTTTNGLTTIDRIYRQMKGLVQSAKTADAAIMSELSAQWKEMFTQADSVATDSSYQGKSLLCPDKIPPGFDFSDYWSVGKNVGIPDTPVQVSPDQTDAVVNLKTIPLPSIDPVLATDQSQPPPNPSTFVWNQVYPVPPLGIGSVTINQNALNNIPGFYYGDTPNPAVNALTNLAPTNWGLNAYVAGDSSCAALVINAGAMQVQDSHGNMLPLNDPSVTMVLSNGTGYTPSNIVTVSAVNVIDQKTSATAPVGPLSAFTAGVTLVAPDGFTQTLAMVQVTKDPGPVQQPPYFDINHPQSYLDPPTNLPAAESWCNKAISYANAAQSNFATNITTLQNRINFSNTMDNTLSEGSDKLTLADLNEEGAALLALQIREQIGISSISVAGQAQSNIMSLLR